MTAPRDMGRRSKRAKLQLRFGVCAKSGCGRPVQLPALPWGAGGILFYPFPPCNTIRHGELKTKG